VVTFIEMVTNQTKVALPPKKPLLVYDGECNFCKFWILRWQRATKDRVDYIASQDPRIAQQFPELPPESFEESVQLILPDGTVYSGAEAVFRSLTVSHAWGWLLWLYQNVPGFRPVTESAYHFVAHRREGFSVLTRWLWGREGALPSFVLVRSVFLRCLGAMYLIAFISLSVQMDGLIGQNGIVPAPSYMQAARAQCDQNQIGWARYRLLPTLCWVSASDKFLHTLGGVGCVLSVLVIFDVAPALCLFLLWAIYLSLSSVGNVFLMFQWDALLLETGFLAIFFAPLQIFPKRNTSPPPSRTMLWLLRWLVFRLMFESGLVKLIGGDVNWRNLGALKYHYETQPLPTWLGWYAHQLPAGFQHFCVFMVFVIELAVPFLIFAPRRLRFIGFWLLVFLQVCILLTGNYCFFNLLTIGLCLLLLDDAALLRFVPSRWRARFIPANPAATTNIQNPAPYGQESMALGEIKVPESHPSTPPRRHSWQGWIIAPVAIVTMLISFAQLVEMGEGRSVVPDPIVSMQQWLAPFESVNRYGLFQMMTTSRLEIVVEGSDDGTAWKSYEFKYKPGDLKRRPGFVAPHQPRLDWQMWFAALGDYRENPWFVNFCVRLLQGAPEVLALLEHNPFPNAPPRYIRARVYDYHFSNFQQRRAEGVWWVRQYKGEYLPAFSLADVRINPT
jgi:predicted DCC family thiol-disulfide oxidoreductase YuxK